MINWKEMNKKAVLIFANGKVRHLMDSVSFGSQYEVGEEDEYYTVTVKDLGGRTEFTCNCKNGTIFCNSPTVCCHRLAVILFTQREIFK